MEDLDILILPTSLPVLYLGSAPYSATFWGTPLAEITLTKPLTSTPNIQKCRVRTDTSKYQVFEF